MYSICSFYYRRRKGIRARYRLTVTQSFCSQQEAGIDLPDPHM